MSNKEAGLIETWFDMDEIEEVEIRQIEVGTNRPKAEARFYYEGYRYYLLLERETRQVTMPVLGEATTFHQAPQHEQDEDSQYHQGVP